MGRYRRAYKAICMLAALVAIYLVLLIASGFGDYLSFDVLRENRDWLREEVRRHYMLSVAGFVGFFVLTAFFLPGAIPLTLVGGFLFGVVRAVIYINLGATLGATLASLFSRHVAGNWLQKRYGERLTKFNEELSRRGDIYLLLLRVLPVMPFFLVNFFAGLTKIPARTLIWTTSLGIMPGSVLYAYAGRELGRINSIEDVFSARMMLVFLLVALLITLPVVLWRKNLRMRS